MGAVGDVAMLAVFGFLVELSCFHIWLTSKGMTTAQYVENYRATVSLKVFQRLILALELALILILIDCADNEPTGTGEQRSQQQNLRRNRDPHYVNRTARDDDDSAARSAGEHRCELVHAVQVLHQSR